MLQLKLLAHIPEEEETHISEEKVYTKAVKASL